MSAERGRQIDDLLDLALEKGEAALEDACAGEPELLAEVRSLLASLEGAGGGWLSEPAAVTLGAEAPVLPLLAASDRVGSYEIVSVVGAGGAGTVYEAIQDRPHRRVALKIMSADLGSDPARRRFDREAEILARLKHPGIAHVYEAGVQEAAGTAFPWFAMEFVEGARPVTRYADEEGLSIRARLRLLSGICDAVHHGHQRGIIHRDLKPGNVLVDSTSRVRIIDFGIARAADPGATPDREIIGTPAYMSPEQCEPGGDVDARTDVYSLGVLLHELVTGRLPHDVSGLPALEAMRRIREQPPADDPRLRGDVRAIVRRALCRDRDARYASASALADDLRRHLESRPVEARSGGLLYQIGRLARRHRLACVAVAAVVLISVTAAIVSGRSALTAERERRSAELQAYIANLAAASAALRMNDIGEARQRLALAPEHLRNWEWRHLSGRIDASLRTHAMPGFGIFTAATSADGRLAAASGNHPGSNRLRVWDIVSNEVRFDVVTERGCARAVSFRPDGEVVAAGFRCGTVEIRDVATGGVRTTIRAHDEEVIDLAWSPRGDLLATGSRDGTIRLWRPGEEEPVGELTGHPDRVICLAFGPRGDRLYSGGRGGQIRKWDVATGKTLAVLEGHEGSVEGVAVSADGRRLVSGSRDGTVRTWDLQSDVSLAVGIGHQGNVRDVAITPDGKTAVSASYDRTVRLWDAARGTQTAVLCGHTGAVRAVRVLSGGARVLSFSADGSAKTWALEPRDSVPTLRGHADEVTDLAFSPDGRRLASGSGDGTVRVWDPDAREEISVLRGHDSPVRVVLYVKSGERLLTGAANGRVRVWDSETSKLLANRGGSVVIDAVPDPAHRRVFLAVGDHQQVRTWCTERNVYGSGWRAGEGVVLALAGDGSGGWLVTGGRQGILRLWDPAAPDRPVAKSAHGSRIGALAASADGKLCASGSWDRTVVLFDTRTLERRKVLLGHQGRVTSLAFSPDGTRLASGGADGTVRLWDVETGLQVAVLHGHRPTAVVSALAFSPDGSRLASGGGLPEVPGTIRLWEAADVSPR